MSDQLSLLDLPADPMARATDPEPVKASARAVDVNAREAEVVEALRLLVVASDTADIQRVLAERNMQREKNCISRRLTSLERKGMARRAGAKQLDRGVVRTLWALTEKGRAA